MEVVKELNCVFHFWNCDKFLIERVNACVKLVAITFCFTFRTFSFFFYSPLLFPQTKQKSFNLRNASRPIGPKEISCFFLFFSQWYLRQRSTHKEKYFLRGTCFSALIVLNENELNAFATRLQVRNICWNFAWQQFHYHEKSSVFTVVVNTRNPPRAYFGGSVAPHILETFSQGLRPRTPIWKQ